MSEKKAEMHVIKEDIKKYLNDFDNLSECGFFSGAFIDDHVFYHKGLTLYQFLQVGRELIREYGMTPRLSELQPEPKPVNKTDEQAAINYTELKVDIRAEYYSHEYDLSESAFLAGCQHARANEAEKALLFAEWCSKSSLIFREVENRWCMVIRFNILKEHDIEYAATSELYASPEFLAYYEERRVK